MGNIRETEIRGVNSKLLAIDLTYDSEVDIEVVIAYIIQKYDPAKTMSGVPYVLRLRAQDFKKDIIESLKIIGKKAAIIEVNSDIFEDRRTSEIVQQIKRELGFKLIVEVNSTDTVFSNTNNLATFIKMNVKSLPNMINISLSKNIERIAVNVDTPEDYKIAEALQVSYLEGTYISDNLDKSIESIKYSKLVFTQILNALGVGDNKDSAIANKEFSAETKEKIVKLISKDCLLTAQLIRLSNSVYFNDNTYSGDINIGSIRDAIEKISHQKLVSWLITLSFNIDNTVSEEAIQLAYHRALFCRKVMELLIKQDKNNEKLLTARKAYIIGLFSTLDILTGQPMEQIISSLDIATSISDALIYREGIGGKILNLVIAYENNDNATAKRSDDDCGHVDKYIKELKLKNLDIEMIYYDALRHACKAWEELEKGKEEYDKSINV